MKAYIHFNGEPAAGLPDRTFEIDFDDMLDQSLEEDLEEETDNRKWIKNKISELVEGVQDSGFSILFSDECACCGTLMKTNPEFTTDTKYPDWDKEWICPNPHCIVNIEVPDLGEG